MGVFVRCLQALRERRLPGSLSDRLDRAHRIRRRLHSAGHLQRLRILRSACPFGVVERNHDDGRAFKCTFCYDRQKVGLQPACAKACPTESIKFGEIEDLRREAHRTESRNCRAAAWMMLHSMIRRIPAWSGTHAMFIVRGDPRSYNLPPTPEVPTVYLKKRGRSSAIGAGLLLAGTLLAFSCRWSLLERDVGR